MEYTWEMTSKKAYWDRSINLDTWRSKVISGHPSYLPDAVKRMSAKEFIYFLGQEQFILNWPTMLASLPTAYVSNSWICTLNWSVLVSGSWNLLPKENFWLLSKKRREFFIQTAKQHGATIYCIAKSLNMQYRRAHEHAMDLIASSDIRGEHVFENGRKKLNFTRNMQHLN